jgi:hypothetical protein
MPIPRVCYPCTRASGFSPHGTYRTPRIPALQGRTSQNRLPVPPAINGQSTQWWAKSLQGVVACAGPCAPRLSERLLHPDAKSLPPRASNIRACLYVEQRRWHAGRRAHSDRGGAAIIGGLLPESGAIAGMERVDRVAVHGHLGSRAAAGQRHPRPQHLGRHPVARPRLLHKGSDHAVCCRRALRAPSSPGRHYRMSPLCSLLTPPRLPSARLRLPCPPVGTRASPARVRPLPDSYSWRPRSPHRPSAHPPHPLRPQANGYQLGRGCQCVVASQDVPAAHARRLAPGSSYVPHLYGPPSGQDDRLCRFPRGCREAALRQHLHTVAR